MASKLVLNYTFTFIMTLVYHIWLYYITLYIILHILYYINPSWTQVSHYGNAKCFASRPSKRQLLDSDKDCALFLISCWLVIKRVCIFS